jgi:hypothetical protein
MAQDFKRYTKNDVGTVVVNIPTSDFTTNDALVGVHISNIVTSSIAVDVYINDGTDNIYLVKGAPIPPGSALQLLDGGAKIVVQSGDQLHIKSDTASSADVWVSVVAAIS